MHIHFTRLRYKNILSVGNHFIDLNLCDSKTTLISGTNGSGKSTMLEALVFALYGKSFRKINKPQLINSINKKDLMVEVYFSIGATDYIIKRGIKPNVFEIWRNDELLNKDAASRDYQEYLEEQILKTSFKSFNQIVILGSATYVPFMELTTAQRREIIEDLLDIQVFSTMSTLLKERVSENKSNLTDNSYQIDLTKTKIKSAEDHNRELQNIKETQIGKIKERINTSLKNIEDAKSVIAEKEKSVAELESQFEDKDEKIKTETKISELLRDLSSKKNALASEIKFYETNDECPTCKQDLNETFKNDTIVDHTKKLEEVNSALEKLKDKKDKISSRLEEIRKIENQISAIETEINEQKVSIKMSMTHLNGYKEELDDAQKEAEAIDENKIKKLRDELKGLESEKSDLLHTKESLNFVAMMLKDGGIKTSIIKTYIPIMNNLINKYLQDFELFVDFHLNENFGETIKSRYRDAFSFASFSEGEKMRISLSILFTWRALAKLRNSVSTNLLIMDEVLDSASDASGIESLIDIIHNTNNKDNIFVISHRGESYIDRFEQHLHFKKVKNFTELAA